MDDDDRLFTLLGQLSKLLNRRCKKGAIISLKINCLLLVFYFSFDNYTNQINFKLVPIHS